MERLDPFTEVVRLSQPAIAVALKLDGGRKHSIFGIIEKLLRRALRDSRDEWKVAYFHHPLYCNAARHGAAVDIRLLVEPLLVRYGVAVAFSGHDHIYERLKPQKGIHYFVSGAGGKLRKGDVRRSDTTAAAFDEDCSFMLVEIDGPEMFFQVISRTGAAVDAGSIVRQRHWGT